MLLKRIRGIVIAARKVTIRSELEGALEQIRSAERLDEVHEAIQEAVHEYEWILLGRYTGGFSRFVLDLRARQADLLTRCTSGKVPVSDFMTRAYPINYLSEKGSGIEELRARHSAYLATRLSPLEDEWRELSREAMSVRLLKHGYAASDVKYVTARIIKKTMGVEDWRGANQSLPVPWALDRLCDAIAESQSITQEHRRLLAELKRQEQ